MRLIDADKLKNELRSLSWNNIDLCEHLLAYVDDQPTVIDVPNIFVERLIEYASEEAHIPASLTDKEKQERDIAKELQKRLDVNREIFGRFGV